MLFLHYGVGVASLIMFSRFAPEVNGSSGAFYFSGQARKLALKKQKRLKASPVQDNKPPTTSPLQVPSSAMFDLIFILSWLGVKHCYLFPYVSMLL